MDALHRFSSWYADFHGYLSLLVCAVGVLCNFFIIIVLTRKNLTTTTNYLLTALAISDLLTMASYIPYALQFHCLYGTAKSAERNSYHWVVFLWFHVNFSLTTHTASIWFGVLLAAFRFSYVRSTRLRRDDGGALHSQTGATASLKDVRRRTRWAVASVSVLSVVVLLPNYFTVTIETSSSSSSSAAAAGGGQGGEEKGNETTTEMVLVYEVVSTVNASAAAADGLGQAFVLVNFWTQALVVKLIPCLLMSIFGFLLIRTMMTSHRKRSAILTAAGSSAHAQRRTWQRRHYRTTAILVAIITLFLVTELPQGTLAVCSGLVPGFFEEYYVPLGDVMDITALVNNGVNFGLYCVMSNRFRKTFLQMFCHMCPRNSSTVVTVRRELIYSTKAMTDPNPAMCSHRCSAARSLQSFSNCRDSG